MKRIKLIILLCWIFAVILLTASVESAAGPFVSGTTYEPFYPVDMNSPDIVAWATGWENYIVGEEVDALWQTPEKALGPAAGTSYDIVCLGRGGQITMTFEHGIKNGNGWDFAVFENSFSDTFLELGYVEVSTNGVDFVRFDNVSLTKDPVGEYGSVDYTEIHGFAGKYRQGLGTPFDLADLTYKIEVTSGQVNLDRIYYVKVVDIVGDGSCMENRPPGWGDNGNIYDPYPTHGSAGFDLDAIGVRYQVENKAMPWIPLLLLNSQD
ncbi:MAG: PEP-CTERM sorting domain-containing protein [Deltaproteobacteria bacterium]|nr:PEP-CTERM sorting domain-containing protein [Deltaproteobacteria bacterium]MBW2114449.1 PEP-CTERM sorting domain-containing protein [Deltaproteobacteria bacterium]